MNKTAIKKKKKIASLDAKKSRAGWLFVLPFLLGFVLLYIPMLFQSIQFSFSEITITVGSKFVSQMTGQGKENIKKLSEDGYKVKILQDKLLEKYEIKVQD